MLVLDIKYCTYKGNNLYHTFIYQKDSAIKFKQTLN